MNYLNRPTLPEWDKAQARDNWNAIKKVLDTFFGQVAQRTNAAFMKDGSEPMKVVSSTLPAGTVYFQGRTRSDTINAYLDAGNWRSWDTARPSWRITQDMANDRVHVERAAATTGNLTWVVFLSIGSGGSVSHPLQSFARAYVSASYAAAAGGTNILQLNTESWDLQSEYDTAAYRFTPTSTGYYMVLGTVMVQSDDTGLQMIIRRGGVNYSTVDYNDVQGFFSIPVNDVVEVTTPASHYIEIFLYTAAGNTVLGAVGARTRTGVTIIKVA